MAQHLYWSLNITATQNTAGDVVEVGDLKFKNQSGVNVCTGGAASATSFISGYPAINAFDGNLYSSWISSAPLGGGQRLTYQLASPDNIYTYEITKVIGGNDDSNPKSWTLEYSDDGVNWRVADTRVNYFFSANATTFNITQGTTMLTDCFLGEQTTITTGTGNLTLINTTANGRRNFADTHAVGGSFLGMVQSQDLAIWEVCTMTVVSLSPTVVSRGTVIDGSSGSGVTVTIPAGTSTVKSIPVPARLLPDASNKINCHGACLANVSKSVVVASGITSLLSSAQSEVTLLNQATSTAASTWTISSDALYLIGSSTRLIGQAGSGVVTLVMTGVDTLTLAPAGTTGSRTLTAPFDATLTKITATDWMISGVGIT